MSISLSKITKNTISTVKTEKIKTITYQQPINEVFGFGWKIIWNSQVSSNNSLKYKPLTCIFERWSSWKHLVQSAAKCPEIISVCTYNMMEIKIMDDKQVLDLWQLTQIKINSKEKALHTISKLEELQQQ